jgi:hypothetical protein
VDGDRSYELLQELRSLRLLAERQVELLQAILEMQAPIEQEIVRRLQ